MSAPRPYQTAAVIAVLTELGLAARYRHVMPTMDAGLLARYCPQLPTSGKPVDSTVLNLTTGAGKTNIAGYLTEIITSDPSARVLFIGDTDELVTQPFNRFVSMGIHPQIEKAGRKADLRAQVVVASAQTLDKPARRQRYPGGHFLLAIADECHRRSPATLRTLDDLAPEYRAGLSATAFRTGEGDLTSYFDTKCFEFGVFDLEDEGYSVPIVWDTIPIKVDISRVHSLGGDYVDSELSSAITPWFEAIAAALVERASDWHQVASYLPLCASSKLFAQVCRHHGLSSEHVDGSAAMKNDRAGILRRYEAREFRNICNASMLTTGWDCPPVSCIVPLVPSRSTSKIRQIVGRGLRVLSGVVDGLATAAERRAAIASSAKPHCLIFDLLWEVSKHGVQGPAAMLDCNEEMAGKVNAAARRNRSPEDLREIARRVQREIEEKLKKKLEWASRQDIGLFDAKAFLAMQDNAALLNYQPFSPWEKQPVTHISRRVLERQGIDPETVTCEGEAHRLKKELGKRAYFNATPLNKFLSLPFDKAEERIKAETARIAADLARR